MGTAATLIVRHGVQDHGAWRTVSEIVEAAHITAVAAPWSGRPAFEIAVEA
jgi:hypothetical protein